MSLFKRLFSKKADAEQNTEPRTAESVDSTPAVDIIEKPVEVVREDEQQTVKFPPVFKTKDDFSQGVQVNGVLIRRARSNDRSVFERHYKMAMGVSDPLDPAQMKNFGGYGSMVIAMAIGDDDYWASRAKACSIVNELWHAMTIVLIAEIDGKVVGSTMIGPPRFQLVQYVQQLKGQGYSDEQLHSSVLMLSMGSAKLFSLAVDETARKQGVGKSLTEAGLSLFEAGGYGIVWGQCPPTARGFYKNLGFEVLPIGQPLEMKRESVHWDFMSSPHREHMISMKFRERTNTDLGMLAINRGYPVPSGKEADIEWAQFFDGELHGLMVAPTIEAWAHVGMSGDVPWPAVSALEVQIDFRKGQVRIGGTNSGVQSVSFQTDPADFEWMRSMVQAGKCLLLTTEQVSPEALTKRKLTATVPVRSV